MIDTLVSSSVLVSAVCILRCLLKGRVSPRLQYMLWLLPLFRMVLPWFYPFSELLGTWKSAFSVMTAAERVKDQMIGGTAWEYVADNLVSGRVYGSLEQAPALAARAAAVDLQLYIMGIWIAGSLAIAGWMVFVNLRFSRWLKRNRRPYTGSIPAFVNRPVWVVSGLSSPCYMKFGGSEHLYLPEEIAADETMARHALAHETGHVLHADLMWGIVRCVLLCYYWVNPFVWIAAVLSRRDGELFCDETAVALLGEEERYAYGKTILDIAAQHTSGGSLFSAATTMGAGKRTLKERIQILAKAPKTSCMAAAICCGIAVCLAACTYSAAKTGPDSSEASAGEAGAGQSGDDEPRGRGESEAAGGPENETSDQARSPGYGDELAVLESRRYGNFYRLTVQRRDAQTKEPMELTWNFPGEGGFQFEVLLLGDGAGSAGEHPVMGYGTSRVTAEDFSQATVDIWNVEGAKEVQMILSDGYGKTVCSYELEDAEPLSVSLEEQVIAGAGDTRAVISQMTIYSNAVWLRLAGETPEKAQEFLDENAVILEVETREGIQQFHNQRIVYGGRNGAVIDLLYLFETELFPGAEVKRVRAEAWGR